MLSRCCFHHLVESPILYKKIYTALLLGPTLFSENKIIRSVDGGKVDGQFYLVPGVRNRKFYLVPWVRNENIYLVPNHSYVKFYLAVKGLKNSWN